jgi:hypothetical protein
MRTTDLLLLLVVVPVVSPDAEPGQAGHGNRAARDLRRELELPARGETSRGKRVSACASGRTDGKKGRAPCPSRSWRSVE